MPGIRALQRVQISQMALNGTTDVATTYWRGLGVLDDTLEVVFPDENIGIIGGVNRSYIPKTGGEISLEGDATFEQLPYIFDAGIQAATPTTDTGTGTGYIYTYNMQFSDTDNISSSDINYLVIEGGDNQQAEIMRSGFVRELTLSGSQGEALMVTALVEGKEVSTTTFTSGLSIPTVETILFSKAKLYIDPSSDAIGSTQKSSTILSAELSLTTGWQAIPVGDGSLDFSSVKRVADEGTLNITFEHDASATAEIVNWRAQNERGLRIIIEGNALTSAGTYTYKTLILDVYGKWSDFEPLDESDGNNTVSGTFRIGYSSAAAAKGQLVVVNDLATLP